MWRRSFKFFKSSNFDIIHFWVVPARGIFMNSQKKSTPESPARPPNPALVRVCPAVGTMACAGGKPRRSFFMTRGKYFGYMYFGSALDILGIYIGCATSALSRYFWHASEIFILRIYRTAILRICFGYTSAILGVYFHASITSLGPLIGTLVLLQFERTSVRGTNLAKLVTAWQQSLR